MVRDSSTPLSPASCISLLGRLREFIGRCLTLVRATAFWATILLPLVVLTALITDTVTTAPYLVGVLVCLNIGCIIFGHDYRPGQ